MALKTSMHQMRHLTFLAKRLELRRPREARGRCFAVSLDLAVQAHALWGLDLNLVRWRVVGEPDYVDHWAVLRDEHSVFDLTRVQVTGRAQLVCDLKDYPTHFLNRRVYPASLLRSAYTRSQPHDHGRLPSGFLWCCGLTLCWHDVRCAVHSGSYGQFYWALREALTFFRCWSMGALTLWLERRSQMLIARLRAQPDLSSRSTRGAWQASASSAQSMLWQVSEFGAVANSHVYSLCAVLGCL